MSLAIFSPLFVCGRFASKSIDQIFVRSTPPTGHVWRVHLPPRVTCGIRPNGCKCPRKKKKIPKHCERGAMLLAMKNYGSFIVTHVSFWSPQKRKNKNTSPHSIPRGKRCSVGKLDAEKTREAATKNTRKAANVKLLVVVAAFIDPKSSELEPGLGMFLG